MSSDRPLRHVVLEISNAPRYRSFDSASNIHGLRSGVSFSRRFQGTGTLAAGIFRMHLLSPVAQYTITQYTNIHFIYRKTGSPCVMLPLVPSGGFTNTIDRPPAAIDDTPIEQKKERNDIAKRRLHVGINIFVSGVPANTRTGSITSANIPRFHDIRTEFGASCRTGGRDARTVTIRLMARWCRSDRSKKYRYIDIIAILESHLHAQWTMISRFCAHARGKTHIEVRSIAVGRSIFGWKILNTVYSICVDGILQVRI